MITLPPNWKDLAPTHPGERKETPPPGAYVCRVVNVVNTQSKKTGSPMLKLIFDIAEGPFYNFFTDDNDERAKNYYSPKWPVFYQIIDGKSISHFKGMIDDFERSNDRFTFKGDEQSLKGKFIGVLFELEEYMFNDKLRRSLIPTRTYSVSQVRENKTATPRIKGLDGKWRALDDPPAPDPVGKPVDDVDIPF